MGASLVGVSDLFANCAPTALSKKPPPEEAGLEEDEGLEEEGLGEEALVGVSDFFANCAPTALSKNPPPEEAGLEEPATQVRNVERHSPLQQGNLQATTARQYLVLVRQNVTRRCTCERLLLCWMCSFCLLRLQGSDQASPLPVEGRGACLGASLLGVPDLLANCAPTALSKKPPPEEAGLEEVGLGEEGLGEAALVGVSDFLANCAPTALSKKPPPEEAGLEVPTAHMYRVVVLWFTVASYS